MPGITYWGYEYNGESCILVVINPEYFDNAHTSAISVIAHEAHHVAHRLLGYNELSLSDETTEAFANVTGWAADCIYKTYQKWLKK